MTQMQKRIAIAKACGWTHIENVNTMATDGIWFGYPPTGAIIGKKEPLPNYFGDLNAMHEAEKLLPGIDKWWRFCTHLNTIVCLDADEPFNQDPETLWCMLHSTAQQRADAFIATIKDQLEAEL